MTRPQTFILAFLCPLLLAFAACEPSQPSPPRVDIDRQVTFQTIEAVEDLEIGEDRAYPLQAAALFAIWEGDQIARVEQWITEEALEQLNALDFTQYAAIVVFQGLKGSNGYNVVIEQIGVRDNTLVVVAQFWQNPPLAPSGAVMTSPYHLVRIVKDNQLSTEVNTELYSYIQYH
jgi:hypothetical protein